MRARETNNDIMLIMGREKKKKPYYLYVHTSVRARGLMIMHVRVQFFREFRFQPSAVYDRFSSLVGLPVKRTATPTTCLSKIKKKKKK
jgi:hypothetical protein